MGIKIFRDDNWHRITNGIISRKDIMHLDGGYTAGMFLETRDENKGLDKFFSWIEER